MGTVTGMKMLLLVLAASAVLARDLEVIQSRFDNDNNYDYDCPMHGIDLWGNDLDKIHGIGSWEACAHICNIAWEANCQFWTWHTEWHDCTLKSSDTGMTGHPAAISGERGCSGQRV